MSVVRALARRVRGLLRTVGLLALSGLRPRRLREQQPRADQLERTEAQEATLRKDWEGLLRPSGVSPEVKGRPASNRQGYAQGSLRAVRFLAGKRSGLFDMADVLGLK